MKVSKQLPAIQERIDKLEAAGMDVYLSHENYESQYWSKILGRPYDFGQHGRKITGRTFVRIAYNDESSRAVGWSECVAGDTFDRVRGTQLAFNRAIHELSGKIGRDRVKKIFGEKA